MKKSTRLTLILVILFSFFGNISVQPAQAAIDWTVTNSNASGAGSLRQAILDRADADDGHVVGEVVGHLHHPALQLHPAGPAALHRLCRDGKDEIDINSQTTAIQYFNWATMAGG